MPNNAGNYPMWLLSDIPCLCVPPGAQADRHAACRPAHSTANARCSLLAASDPGAPTRRLAAWPPAHLQLLPHNPAMHLPHARHDEQRRTQVYQLHTAEKNPQQLSQHLA
jgi:hypothetical protein